MLNRGVEVAVGQAKTCTYSSVLLLAEAFGGPVLEPSWWPEDAGRVEFHLDRFPDRAYYRLDATLSDGAALITVVGHTPWPGDIPQATGWASEFIAADRHCRIRTIGSPARFQALVSDDELSVHLVGYGSENDVLAACRSLRRIAPSALGDRS